MVGAPAIISKGNETHKRLMTMEIINTENTRDIPLGKYRLYDTATFMDFDSHTPYQDGEIFLYRVNQYGTYNIYVGSVKPSEKENFLEAFRAAGGEI
jgi:hypothetical protein